MNQPVLSLVAERTCMAKWSWLMNHLCLRMFRTLKTEGLSSVASRFPGVGSFESPTRLRVSLGTAGVKAATASPLVDAVAGTGGGEEGVLHLEP